MFVSIASRKGGLRFFRRAALIGLFALPAAACGNDGEILASFEGGDVQRGELRKMFEVMFGPEAGEYATVEQQDRILKNYALVKIAAEKAREAGLQESEGAQKQMPLADEQARLVAYRVQLQRDFDEHEYKMAEMQLIFLRSRPDGEGRPEPGSRKQEAEDILAELKADNLSGAKLHEYIRTKSEHPRYKWNGGLLDPHCLSCRPNPLSFLTDKVEEAGEGQWTYVETPEAAWIVRASEIYTANPGDLEDSFAEFYENSSRIAESMTAELGEQEKQENRIDQVVMDEKSIKDLATQQAERLINQERRSLFGAKLVALSESKDLQVADAAQPRGELDEALYTEETKLFTMQQGDSRVEYTYGDLKGDLDGAADEMSLAEQLQTLNSVIVPLKLLQDEPAFENARNSEIYDFLVELRERDTLASLYYEKKSSEPEVSAQDVREWYDVQKQTRYQGKSFAQVRDEIEQQLLQRARQSAVQQVQDQLAKEYNLEIKREKLKANEL